MTNYRVELSIMDLVLTEEIAEYLVEGFGLSCYTDTDLDITILTLHCSADSTTEAAMKILRAAHQALPQTPPCSMVLNITEALSEEEAAAKVGTLLGKLAT